MKYYSHILLGISVLLGALLLPACNDDPDVVANAPRLTLSEPVDLRRTSVTLNGMLEATELSKIRECGFRIGRTSSLGDDAQTYRMADIPSGEFSAVVKGLEIGQPYFYAAYVSNGSQTMLSEVRALTTLTKSGAFVTDLALTDPATCTVRAVVEDDGGAEVKIAGFCWNTTPNPTVYDDNVRVTPAADGSFSAALSDFQANTTYYVRAFADNDMAGTGTSSISYSEQLEIRLEHDPDNPDDPEKTFVTIPDANFKAYLVENFDKNGDGEISLAEAALVTRIEVCTDNIESLEGIEKFVNLEYLKCAGTYTDATQKFNGILKTLDVSKNTALTDLECYFNQLTNLDVSKNTALKELVCTGNQLTNLDVSKNTALTYLNCNANQLTTLDVSKNTALTELGCGENQLTALDVSKNTALIYLTCLQNPLIALDVSKNTALKDLSCRSNQLTILDVSKNTALTRLDCLGNQLTILDVSKNAALTVLSCGYNQLTALDVSKNTALTGLGCGSNQLSILDISNNTALQALDARFNPDLTKIYVWQGFDKASEFEKDATAEYVVRGSDEDTIVTIPDANFKAYLVENFDTNGDGDISQAEADAITGIEVNTDNIASVVGIEKLRNLVTATLEGTPNPGYATGNGLLTAIDVSPLMKLQRLDCYYNQIRNIALPANGVLESLGCASNKLNSLEFVKKCASLTDITCWGNPVNGELDFSQTKLEQLFLSEVDGELSGVTSVKVPSTSQTVVVSGCKITTIDVRHCPNLTVFHARNCSLTETLDISQNPLINRFYVTGNPKLKYIYVWADFDKASDQWFEKDVTAEYILEGSENPIEIKDANFKRFLVLDYDKNNDGEISQLEADAITEIDVNTSTNGWDIHSLEGIEYLHNLQSLKVTTPSSNKGGLTTLDVSRNMSLVTLDCSDNQLTSLKVPSSLLYLTCEFNLLTSLDLTNASSLVTLDCWGNDLLSLNLQNCKRLTSINCNANELTTLDLSGNTELLYLSSKWNQLTTLDLSKNLKLQSVNCMDNNLSGVIDVSTNTDLTWFAVTRNPNLETIYVWPGFDLALSGFRERDQTVVLIEKGVVVDKVDIPDPDFLKYLVSKYDVSGDKVMSRTEIESVTTVQIDSRYVGSLTGIEQMKNLQKLEVHNQVDYPWYGAAKVTSVDISHNPALTYLDCHGNGWATLDISHNPALTYLNCRGNQLNSLDVSGHAALKELICGGDNQLKTLNITGCGSLTNLDCDYSKQLNTLTVSDCGALKRLSCSSGGLSVLSVSNCAALTGLYCDDNELKSLNISGCAALTTLWCNGNELTTLDVSKNTALTGLECDSNQLTTLDVSKNTALTRLDCYNNQLTTLDVSNNRNLTVLDVCKNPDLKIIYVWKGFNEANYSGFSKDAIATYVEKTN